ncbi:MAG: hypothetical protein AB7I25_03730 [Vicinamibacterales bacterium]
MTVPTSVAITSVRRLAVVEATGTVRPAGGIAGALRGTFDDTSRALALSGGGYTFAGNVAADGILIGTYTGPDDARGGFSALNSTSNPVTVFCGSAAENEIGREGPIPFTLQVSSNGAVSGMVLGDPACALTGRANGTSVSVTDCEGRPNTGTILGGTVSGTTPSGARFSGSTSACQ